ncbi:MAG: tetratricopeptide repeat protein [Myxococcota bacterium]
MELWVADLERCWGEGDFEGCRAALDRLAEREPDRREWAFRRGVLEQEVGDTLAAVGAYERAVQIDPTYSDAWINLGRLLDDRRLWDDALECYDRALALPDGAVDPMAWVNRGNTLMSLGRLDEALVSFDRGLALDPDDGPGQLGRHVVLGWLGRLAESGAARPVGTPFDRGEARERSANAGERRVVARWFLGRHTRPEWLDDAARALVEGVAALPGLADGATVQWGWSLLTVREQGTDLVLCEPDFAAAPFDEIVWDVTFTLQTLVMHRLVLEHVEAEPSDCRMSDRIAVAPGALDEEVVLLRRLSERTDDGDSGWLLTAEGGSTHEPIPLHTGHLARLRTGLIKALLLPPGTVARFEGEVLTHVFDPEGNDRLA